MRLNFQSGFHLLELLITLSIIGLLVSISMPLYSHYFTQAYRLEAANSLNKLAIALEKYQIEHTSYADVSLEKLGLKEFIAKNHYRLEITAVNDHDYQIKAIPIGKQAANDYNCGELTLNAKGEKGITGQGEVTACW